MRAAAFFLIYFGILANAAGAQDAPSPEMLQGALQTAIAQHDQALNDGLRTAAQLTLAQRETPRLRREVEAARAQPGARTE